MNTELLLKRIERIEYNAKRLRTLVEADLMLDKAVPIYCALNIKNESEMILEQLQGKSLMIEQENGEKEKG